MAQFVSERLLLEEIARLWNLRVPTRQIAFGFDRSPGWVLGRLDKARAAGIEVKRRPHVIAKPRIVVQRAEGNTARRFPEALP